MEEMSEARKDFAGKMRGGMKSDPLGEAIKRRAQQLRDWLSGEKAQAAPTGAQKGTSADEDK